MERKYSDLAFGWASKELVGGAATLARPDPWLITDGPLCFLGLLRSAVTPAFEPVRPSAPGPLSGGEYWRHRWYTVPPASSTRSTPHGPWNIRGSGAAE